MKKSSIFSRFNLLTVQFFLVGIGQVVEAVQVSDVVISPLHPTNVEAAFPAPEKRLRRDDPDQVVGIGNSRIHVIPTLSSPSVKNGEILRISVVVKALAGVASVEADLGGIDQVVLNAVSAIGGGQNTSKTCGLYAAEWTAHDLEEKVYSITLRITDNDGVVFEDHSLSFSDPAAGNSSVGSAEYPGMTRVGDLGLPDERNLRCAVIDAAKAYAYFGTDTTPGSVVKVALGDGSSPPTRVGALVLEDREDHLWSAVIDSANGYAYFGTGTVPGRVVKVALGTGDDPPTRVGSLAFFVGENRLTSAVINPTAGYAYFGTESSPGRVVKVALGTGTDSPRRVGSVILEAGEDSLLTGVIAPGEGYAYFGTDTEPGKVIKVALGNGDSPPVRLGSLTLGAGENTVQSAVIDPINRHAYVGVRDQSIGKVVKVSLGVGDNLPTRIGSVEVPDPDAARLLSAVIDPASGYAYFGTGGRFVVKIELGIGSNLPRRVGVVELDPYERDLPSAVIDPSNGYAYFGTNLNPGRIIKVELGLYSDPPVRIGGTVLVSDEKDLVAVVADPANGYVYFCGGSANPRRIVKVGMGDGDSSPRRVGVVELDEDDRRILSAVIDPTNGFMYLGTEGIPGVAGRVVKVALGNGELLPTRIGHLELNTSENSPRSAVIDPSHGYAYFGTSVGTGSVPGTIVKVELGSGLSLPTRVGAVTLNSNEYVPKCGVIDPPSGYAYFGTLNQPGKVVKVSLGVGNNLPTRVGAVLLEDGDAYLESAVIDTANGFAFFGTEAYNNGRVIKVALGTGDNLPTRVGSAVLPTNEFYLRGAVIDPARACAYFLSVFSDRLVKVSLGTGDDPPMRIGALDLNTVEGLQGCLAIDPVNEYVYIGGGGSSRGRIIKVDIDSENYGFIKATEMTVPEDGTLRDVRFYVHEQSGNVRLGIYDDQSPRNLLWQSESTPIPGPENWLTIPVSAGMPGALYLQPGTYWLTFQTDSHSKVASYTEGSFGEGFFTPQTFGPFPPTIGEASVEYTSERWSEYVTYTLRHNLTIASPYGATVPASGTFSYDDGALVHAYVANATLDDPPGSRILCTGWTGTGSVPNIGSGTETTFRITQDSTLEWNWKAQHYLTVSWEPTEGGNVTLEDGITPPSDWYDAGMLVPLIAIPAPGYYFDSWSGDLSGSTSTASIQMSNPQAVNAVFQIVPTATSTPTPTATSSETLTPTWTVTDTSTSTATITPTVSESPTDSVTATDTPSDSPTQTETETSTATSSFTATPSPTWTTNYDVWPPGGNGVVNSADLLEVLKKMEGEMMSLFDFSQHWNEQEGSQN